MSHEELSKIVFAQEMARVENQIELPNPLKDYHTFSEKEADFTFETFECPADQHMNENGK